VTNANGAQALNSMSPEAPAARRYALASFQIANANGDIEVWRKSLREISEFMGDPEVRRVLENSRVGQEPKQRLIAAALADLPEMPQNLARLLVRKGRTNLAVDISEQFEQLMEQERGISRARATTAVPLADAEREALAKQLQVQTGNQVVLETAVDPRLLGGVVIQIGDRLIDASTKGRLEALRESLTGAV
jgi:F-type H+-transporting ATPase subunit delta